MNIIHLERGSRYFIVSLEPRPRFGFWQTEYDGVHNTFGVGWIWFSWGDA